MNKSYVYKNYILPSYPKIAHQLRTYLQNKQQYRNYSLEQIKIVIKNIKADRFHHKKIKKQMGEYQNQTKQQQIKYYRKYIKPIKNIRTYQQYLYELAKTNINIHNKQLNQNKPYYYKAIYQQINKIHPYFKKMYVQHRQHFNNNLVHKRDYFRNRYLPNFIYKSPKEYFQSTIFKIEPIPSVLKSKRLHIVTKKQLQIEHQMPIWQNLSEQQQQMYINKYNTFTKEYNDKIDALCIWNSIQRQKLIKLTQQQYLDQHKYQRQFNNIEKQIQTSVSNKIQHEQTQTLQQWQSEDDDFL